jgi:hypothetical protein
MDKLRERCVNEIQQQLESQGWTEEDIQGYILSEMATVLLEDNRLSISSLGQLMKKRGLKRLQAPAMCPPVT